MRLKSLAVSATISTNEVKQQKDYGDMILAIGEGKSNKDAEIIPELTATSTKKYSLTFNKSQGQEFDQVLLDIREPPFAHGHLYVAMSRIRHYSNIRFFIQNDKTKTQLINNKPTSDNVTYPEILNLALHPTI